eukprot:3770896-Lingulodinium_polyedra.AAC.1
MAQLAAVGPEFWRTLQPGRRGLLFFEDDDVWRERLLVLPAEAAGRRWLCLTPDDDFYIEQLDGYGDAIDF